MARALSDIIKELDSTYNPQRQRQRDLYNQGISDVNPQEEADLAGLNQAKQDSFKSIETGANRRGMFFSGIPLEEQAKYVGSQFLPGVANLKSRYATVRGNLKNTLYQSIANLDENQRKFGQDIYNTEVAQDIERERIATQERLAREEAARAAASAGSGGGGGFSPTFGGGATTSRTATAGGGAAVPAGMQALYNQVFMKSDGGTWDDNALRSDYNATRASAGYGNARDKQKLLLYHAVRPDLFGSSVPASGTFTNSSQIRY